MNTIFAKGFNPPWVAAKLPPEPAPLDAPLIAFLRCRHPMRLTAELHTQHAEDVALLRECLEQLTYAHAGYEIREQIKTRLEKV